MSWLYTIVFVGIVFSGSSDPGYLAKLTTVERPIPVATPTPAGNVVDRFEQSYPLNASGRVSVSNVNGPINMIAWDKNEVRLVAVKRGNTKEHLDNVQLKIDARPDYFSVETDCDEDRMWKTDGDRRWRNNDMVIVEYELSVPRGAMLNEIGTINGSVTVAEFTNLVKVSAVNGVVRGTNLRGTAELSTVNGEVFGDFDKLAVGSKIALETVNGKVNLAIPSDSNATVKAESLNGVITNDFGLPNRRGKYVGNSMHGRLGSGDVSITLESVNGPLSLKRRNDGRSLSPVTNLLTTGDDDDGGDIDIDIDSSNVAKVSRDVDRSVRQAQKNALEDANREMAKIKTKIPKIRAQTMEEINQSINDKVINDVVQESLDIQRATLAGLRDAAFFSGIPRIETKTNSFPVKGTPTVTIDAKGCSVRVRGWDDAEVKYSVTQLRGNMARSSPVVSESKTDNTITLKVSRTGGGLFSGPLDVPRIEVFVPHKANLKIISDHEVRLEGVTGELEITGGDEPVDVRDSEGKIKVTNEDGRVRILGFTGEVTAQTNDGNIYLEGAISKLNAKAASGTVTITCAADANLDVSSSVEPEMQGLVLTSRGPQSWRLGKGGASFIFSSEDGRLIIRNLGDISN